jgi:hypothetical protein
MTTQGIDPADYLAFEHRIDYVPRELPEVRRAVSHRRFAGGDVRRSRAQPRRTETVGDGNDLGHVSRAGDVEPPRPGDPKYQVIGPGQLRTWDLAAFLHCLEGLAFTP